MGNSLPEPGFSERGRELFNSIHLIPGPSHHFRFMSGCIIQCWAFVFPCTCALVSVGAERQQPRIPTTTINPPPKEEDELLHFVHVREHVPDASFLSLGKLWANPAPTSFDWSL